MTRACSVDPTPHAWLHSSPRKRKTRLVDDLLDNQAKRRRYSELEHGFAHLSLNPTSPYPYRSSPRCQGITCPAISGSTLENESVPSSSVPLPSVVDVTSEMSSFFTPVMQPSSVEEPTSNVKAQKWYEPEKDRTCCTPRPCPPSSIVNIGIVIIDLSDFEDETEPVADIVVSRAALDRIKASSTISVIPPKEPAECKALVLFKPMLPLDAPTREQESNDEEPRNIPSSLPIEDEMLITPPEDGDDAMDIDS